MTQTRNVRLFVSKLNGQRETRYAARFALVGVVIAVALAVYVTYLSAAGIPPHKGVFVLLCPPSLTAMPLERPSWDVTLIHWLLIALGNAVLYALVGLLFGAAVEEKPE